MGLSQRPPPGPDRRAQFGVYMVGRVRDEALVRVSHDQHVRIARVEEYRGEVVRGVEGGVDAVYVVFGRPRVPEAICCGEAAAPESGHEREIPLARPVQALMVPRLAGHEHLATTQRYAHANDGDCRRAIEGLASRGNGNSVATGSAA